MMPSERRTRRSGGLNASGHRCLPPPPGDAGGWASSMDFTAEQWKEMAGMIRSSDDLLRLIDKALWYAAIIRKEVDDPMIRSMYSSPMYWIPPMSKLKT